MKHARLGMFVALVILQVLVVGNMARSRQAILSEGEAVTLATAPVDPRDLFRGDYAILRYEISLLDLTRVGWGTEDPYEGQTIWVVLEPDQSGIHRAVAVTDHTEGERWVAIRGMVRFAGDGVVAVEYGIEEYFVPEGTGRQIEAARDLRVVVRLSDDGQAVIDHLIVDGRRWEPQY